MRRELSVSDLAATLYRTGDIHARLEGGVTAEEGMRAHAAVQRQRSEQHGERYLAELAVEGSSVGVTVRGRLDGLLKTDSGWVIEEYKTTRGDPDALHSYLGSLHWAQITLYAALAPLDDAPVTLRLVYLRPDGAEAARFERESHRSAALAFALDATARWSDHLTEHEAYVERRNLALNATSFPFAAYRPNQRALAGSVYAALRDRASHLLEAPTGSGKSMATLFPAARALADGHASRLFFLTTRGTGKAAALAASDVLASAGGVLRRVELTAKQKICFVEGMPCDPEICQYARGYFDRREVAVSELLAQDALDRAQIEAVARRHEVCPFELSLDAALWCDLVICDYNYLFDPQVRLLRFQGEKNSALLIDEAHALSERVQGMYSAELGRTDLAAAAKEAGAQPHLGEVSRRLRSIDRALGQALKPVAQGAVDRLAECDKLLRAILRLRETLAGDDSEPQRLELPERVLDVVFGCLRFERASGWAEPERYVLFADRRERDRLLLSCLDPGPEIRATLDEFAGNVRFSGTLTPLAASQRLHGYDADSARASSIATPYPPGSLFTAVVTDVPTRYRQREDSLPMLADLVAEVTDAKPGRYLLALPSYHYLDRICLEIANRHPRLVVSMQQPDMDDEARIRFIEALKAPQAVSDEVVASSIAAVVLGGVMAESVDYADGALAGAIIVTVALPPPDPVRDAMSAYFRSQGSDGYALAYERPAMTRAIQAAGRVQRDPGDRGVVVLVDDRFAQPGFRRYLPEHWQPEILSRHALPFRLGEFWRRSAEVVTG